MTDDNQNFEYTNLLSKFKNFEKSNKQLNTNTKSQSPKKKGNNSNNSNNYNNNNNSEYNEDIATSQKEETNTTDDATEATMDDDTVNEIENEINNLNKDKIEIENENHNEKDDATGDTNDDNDTKDSKNKNMAQDDSNDANDSRTIEQWLQDNKIYNSELLVVLKANHIDNEDDLKTFFEEGDDIASVIKSVRKRTEKVLAGFSKKIVKLTDIEYEYKAPRHRAKESNISNISSGKNKGYLGSSGNNGNMRPGSPRNRSLSNSSQGSQGSIGGYTYRKHKGRPTPTGKEVTVNANAHNSSQLRSWLQRHNIFNKDLFAYLAGHGYQSPDDLEVLTEKEFDRIVREVRVETFKDVDSSAKRNRVDKLLTKFEVQWRKLSGLRKTNMTKEQQEQWGYSPRTASQRALDEQNDNDGGFFS